MTNISYTIAMPQPHTHLIEVRIDVPDSIDPSAEFVDFTLPSWTPGSYLIRDYARHVQAFAAETNGVALAWHKIAKDTWRVETGGATRIQVRYAVYAYELTVRSSHLDGSHGYFNGATVFMYVSGHEHEPLELHVETPDAWRVTTGLEPLDGQNAPAGTAAFLAADYDELIDCPVECGTHRLLTFEVDGIEHRIALWGHGNEDEAQIVIDTQKIVAVQRDLFGGLPYRHYTFLLHLSDGRGGLEHRNSVSNLVDRWGFQPPRAYEGFLGLQSHEFFHVWNVKRIRAEPLGPFNYRSETYTRLLWAMEGVTSYYDKLFLARAGLMTPQRYLETLADSILTLQGQPGRALQSLEESSFDTWIKFYRPDENSGNTSISYYLKGALVSLLLDMELRARTANTRTMDDVLRYLFTTYPITGPGIPEENGYCAAVEAVAGSDFGDFFARYIDATDELDYAHYLAHAGLELRWSYANPRDDGAAPAWLGVRTRRESEHLKVASARSDGPAYSSGVYAGDELVALDGWRIDEGRLNARIGEHAPGDSVTLTVFRHDELIHIPVTLAASPYDRLTIARVANPTELQERIYTSWLAA